MFFINLNDLEFVIVSWEFVDQVLFVIDIVCKKQFLDNGYIN